MLIRKQFQIETESKIELKGVADVWWRDNAAPAGHTHA